MATAYNGTNYAKSIDPSSANIVDPGILGGVVRVLQDTYTGAVVATGDYIRIGKQLPTGAQVLDVVLTVETLTGSGNFLQVGDEGDADRYIASMSSSAATNSIKVPLQASATWANYQVTGTTDNIIRITSGGTAGAAPLSGGTIKIAVYYTTD